ncbi:neuraminidase-like domain-containing protein [Caballeronia zhejiangensis]|uniref:Tc toxin subunit A-related protein n=1 Tax=Caballeronia zhejiangensis TaxID=871203 RepID=UPI001EF483B6|nr:neuraminidase-like domain-containing protein [Caballeronia zhejiangensis]MCG7405328.1 neuraminidase-like domain-containing protein [Caballeronia zhejiangensis]
MTLIHFPLDSQSSGAQVADLQEGLRRLVETGTLRVSEAEKRALTDAFAAELAAGRYGEVTRQLVIRFQQQNGLRPSGAIDETTAGALNAQLSSAPSTGAGASAQAAPFEVTGTVRYADGSAARSVRIVVVDKDLRSEEALGETVTDDDGVYLIDYARQQLERRERRTADVVVRALAADGSVLSSSGIRFNVPRRTTIDLTIPAEQEERGSLFERIRAALVPLVEKIPVQDLDETPQQPDLSFLAGETGFAQATIARFVMAHRLNTDARPVEFAFAILGGGFFNYRESQTLEARYPQLRASLTSLNAAALDKALQRSFDGNEIPPALREQSKKWIRDFLDAMAARTVEDSQNAGFLKQALDHAGVDAERQHAFAARFNEYKAFMPELIAELEESRTLSTDEVADLRTSFRLADLTQGDFSLVRTIKDEFDVRTPDQLYRIARPSEAQWSKFIAQKQATGDIALPFEVQVPLDMKLPQAESYGKVLADRFHQAFPTSAFSGGLERALRKGDVAGLRRSKDLSAFLDSHPDFELLTTPVDRYLDKQVRREFRDLARDDDFASEVKAVQRVFKLAQTFAGTQAMLADDVHSAQQAYRMGPSEFVRRYANRGMSRSEAELVWNRAADTHAATLTIVGDLKSLDAEALPLVLNNGSDALADFPNWENLFQSGDICHCEDCRSVLSPAAYFADVLMFLKDRKARNPAFTVKDILFARRADLGYLELNCDNALVTLPYVDIVCEVLESAISAGASDIELIGFAAVPGNLAAAKAAVLAALGTININLGAEFSLTQVDPADANRWVAHGEDVTYLLKKKATPNFFAQLLPNTKATAAELRAYPAYVDEQAYKTLRQARFPFALPFDLFADEVRAAFRKCNLQRWDLMRALHGAAAPNNATDVEIAADYFGISCDAAAAFDERRLILTAAATAAGQQAIWGETGNAGWLTPVSNVKVFLRKSGLEYNDLLALLDLDFINPAHDMRIQDLDSSCDTDEKVIQALDVAKLDRIHRFLRMWRKLDGWKLWELDLVIRNAGIGDGTLDDAFVVALYYFDRLRTRLGIKATVEQVCALFEDINVTTRFTGLHEKRADALYQTLFLNRKLTQPLDHAFDVMAVDVPGPTVEKVSGHQPVLLAALGVRQADVDLLTTLKRASNGALYVTDDLTLGNLSFLWRHAWLAKGLRLKVPDWTTLLALLKQDVATFATSRAAFEFVERLDFVTGMGASADDLNWLIAADRTAKAAPKEADTARVLTALRTELQGVRATYDPARYDFLNPPSDPDTLTALLMSLLLSLHRSAAEAQAFIDTLRDELQQEQKVAGLPAGFQFPQAIANAIRIRYDEPAATLRFTGLISAGERNTLLTDAALGAVTGIAAYQKAINELFDQPRLALKFFDPVFKAPLASLPAAVDFKALPDPALVQRISYDAEKRVLQVIGILTEDDQQALNLLSADVPYRAAVNSLKTQPSVGVFPASSLWMRDADLQFPLRDAVMLANDHLAVNLATAITKGLAYLSQTNAESAVVRQASTQFGLTEALTRTLLTEYTVLPATLLAHFTGPFAATSGVVDYATLQSTFDGWYWGLRVATLWRKWKLTSEEWGRLAAITAAAQLFDPLTLPLNSSGVLPAIDRISRTSRLLRMRDTLPEKDTTMLEVLTKLQAGQYAAVADFAADVERVNDAWLAANTAALIGAVDLAYPKDYLLAETWERMRRVFYFVDSLNGGVATIKPFAAATMGAVESHTLKGLLRSKFGGDAWLSLSADIQDVLRERKRDALSAYLLSQPKPADAPSGKWENTSDLYAYYLLDVGMCSCQLTSRLVQASGSAQLFVQRCFMGLEPQVVVKADGDDGDSAWRWWAWMRKFRPWQANLQVWLWPEDVTEPELKKDRSSFFKELESSLMQNEINAQTVETAFTQYLEKLDEVAQLEIAGFFQEDDADETILHVFGRTTGAEPHVYYYRQFDYRQWTPWEKVDLDIQGDYLVPAVVNRRLFLFWPVFSEVEDESQNRTTSTPKADQPNVTVTSTWKKLRLQIAVSDVRQGKWTPKRISKDFVESSSYDKEIVRRAYAFFPVDRSEIDGRFGIKFTGYSIDRSGATQAGLGGAFEISGCKGVPTLTQIPGSFTPVVRPEHASVGDRTSFHKWVELDARGDAPQNDLTFENGIGATTGQYQSLYYTPILEQTPWIFKVTPPWHLSYLDRLLANGMQRLGGLLARESRLVFGSWLPFFYNDKKRTFFVLPMLRQTQRPEVAGVPPGAGGTGIGLYYPDIKRNTRQMRDAFEGLFHTWVDSLDLTTINAADRQNLEQFLAAHVATETTPPFTDELVKTLLLAYLMQFVDYYIGALSLLAYQFRQFHFRNFYHPFVCDFAKLVQNPLKGVPGLMQREVQLKDTGFSFLRSYRPTAWVLDPSTEAYYPKEDVDFSPDGAYASYNWELFFHVPLLIANALSRNQRFEEARNWYHYIFNPIGVESATPGGSPMSKYWITRPFYETTQAQYVQQRIENILALLAGDPSAPGYSAAARKALEEQVRDWRTHPFEPHRIANYRTAAYQKNVVMKYLDNLIAWGDNLFSQDSMESINEATQLYVLAAEILGPSPKKIPPREKPPVESFNELEQKFDVLSNALVEVENLVPALPGGGGGGGALLPAPLPMLYFCIPRNQKLLSYWDTIADRLYKIRHCMNIEGVVRQLALFEPPIDPAALVKAVAGGLDLSAVLADLNAPLPLYRFTTMLQKANELCADVRALGSALLGALEKKDGEAMNLLRQGHEIRLLQAVKGVREIQLDEAKQSLEGVRRSKELAEIRRKYYESREFMNTGETVAVALNTASTLIDASIALGYTLAGGLKLIPNFVLGASGFGGSPHAVVDTGGKSFGDSAEDLVKTLESITKALDKGAALSSTIASYQRRKDDWDLQRDLAAKEIEQFDRQIAAGELRVTIAEKERDNQQLQIENAQAVDELMHSKYTNEELYQWQIGQISAVYFQSYRLAYDLAKRAERCLRFELGLNDSDFISFGYWDSLKKGLLSGEKLQYDLRRMEAAYLEQNRREFELTKHVSLALLDPLALVRLRECGRCFVRLPEEIFDLDYPGHYFRRIKSVSLSLPCVAGPYTTISCTLRLLKNSIRINTSAGNNGYPRNVDDDGLPADDPRFIENNVQARAIATSTAQNDSGVFDLNFRDERYLPFEGPGVISEFALELFTDLPSNNPNPANPDFGRPLRQFDFSTIADAVLHIKYTAREDAGSFRNGAITHLREYFAETGGSPATLMLELRREFATEWQRFLHPTNPGDPNTLELVMSHDLFPMRDSGHVLKINSITMLARCSDANGYAVTLTPPLAGPAPANIVGLARVNEYGGLHLGQKDVSGAAVSLDPAVDPPTWKLTVVPGGGGAMGLEDAVLVLGYQWDD